MGVDGGPGACRKALKGTSAMGRKRTHLHWCSPVLVVVDEIDIRCSLALEFEHDPPVTRDPYSPLSLAIADQGTEPETRRIHHRRRPAEIELRQDQLNLPDVLGSDAACISGRARGGCSRVRPGSVLRACGAAGQESISTQMKEGDAPDAQRVPSPGIKPGPTGQTPWNATDGRPREMGIARRPAVVIHSTTQRVILNAGPEGRISHDPGRGRRKGFIGAVLR